MTIQMNEEKHELQSEDHLFKELDKNRRPGPDGPVRPTQPCRQAIRLRPTSESRSLPVSSENRRRGVGANRTQTAGDGGGLSAIESSSDRMRSRIGTFSKPESGYMSLAHDHSVVLPLGLQAETGSAIV